MKISKEHKPPITRQCRILDISRSNAYYWPQGISEEDRRLMRLLDELHLQFPFSLGLRVRKGCSYHGLSLNLNMD